MGEVQKFVETATGASGSRPEFRQLIDDVKTVAVSDVIVWEISRTAHNGLFS